MTDGAGDALPQSLRDWIEVETGGRVRSARRGGDGASRLAWAVDVETGAGVEGLFCLRDRAPGAGGSSRDARVLRALSGTPVPVPRVRAASADLDALLLERIAGRSDFPNVDRESEREPTARDLMRITAALHALDPARLALEGLLGRPATAAEVASRAVRDLGALVRALADDALPVQRFALAWLERRPPRASRTSLVHSDMGPGNFLYQGGRVTAILDWEVAHWGDPMEDLAAIAVRDMATPIGPLARRFADYRAAGGAPIDLDAVAWYRVFILARNTTLIAQRLLHSRDPAEGKSLAGFQLLLLRALALCLCDVVGAGRPSPDGRPLSDERTSPGGQASPDERARVRRFALDLDARARALAETFAHFADRLPQELVAP